RYVANETHEGVTYVEGKLGDAASDFALEKGIGFGTIDRIVEVYGASHYGALDKVLESYGRLLKPGGKMFLHMDPKTELHDKDGRPLSVASYLRRIGGLRLASAALREDTRELDRAQLQVVLERTSAPLSVPSLVLKSWEPGAPPRRVYATDLPPRAAPEEILPGVIERIRKMDASAIGRTWT